MFKMNNDDNGTEKGLRRGGERKREFGIYRKAIHKITSARVILAIQSYIGRSMMFLWSIIFKKKKIFKRLLKKKDSFCALISNKIANLTPKERKIDMRFYRFMANFSPYNAARYACYVSFLVPSIVVVDVEVLFCFLFLFFCALFLLDTLGISCR